jgi:hypothetical protein
MSEDLQIEVTVTVIRGGRRLPTHVAVCFEEDPETGARTNARFVYCLDEILKADQAELKSGQSTGSADAGI